MTSARSRCSSLLNDKRPVHLIYPFVGKPWPINHCQHLSGLPPPGVGNLWLCSSPLRHYSSAVRYSALQLHAWFSQNGLLLKPDKSEVMYIGTRQRLRISDLPETVTVAGSTIATTDKLKVLGVVLTFDQHVRDTVRNCNFHMRALRHIWPSLTSDVANTIACSIIGSRLDYCNSLLVGISEQNLDSIQRVQSKAARIVRNAGRHSPSSGLLHSLHWLPVRHRIEFKTYSVLQSSKTGHSFLPE